MQTRRYTCFETAERIDGTHLLLDRADAGQHVPQKFAKWVLSGLLVVLFATGPAAAQADNPICADDSGTLVTIIEGFLKITVALGVIGLVLVWQLDSLVEMVTVSREQKLAIKQHKRGAMKSAGTLVVIGPLFTVAGILMGLPIAECVNLIPF